MIQLIISDIDGTIIGRDETLPADLSDFVDRLRRKNIFFTIATGRSEAYLEPLVCKITLDIPYIASNGATIIQNGKALIRKQIPILEIQPILNKAQEMGISLLFTSNGIDRIIEITPWLEKEAKKQKITYVPEPFTEDDWAKYCVEKVLIMDEIRDGRISIIEELCKSVSGGNINYVRYRNKAIEIMEKTANKSEAILELLNILSIPISNVMVIGDDDNDLDMFQLGALSVAVGNASKNVLPYVDYHSEGKQFEGVKEAIERFCGV